VAQNVRNLWLARGRAIAAIPSRRHVAAWLAVFGLYLQLAAAGLCTCGLPALLAVGGPAAFPICHSQTSDAPGQTHNDHAPAPQHECAYCTAHCHAAMGMAPPLRSIDAIHAVSAPAATAAFIVPQAARFPAGAPPRGPPASI
jgi:hypothetical protein